jgi:hypothetical protein
MISRASKGASAPSSDQGPSARVRRRLHHARALHVRRTAGGEVGGDRGEGAQRDGKVE